MNYAGGNEMEETLSELRADVRNLQIHVMDIKAEARATNSRIDSLSDKIDLRFEKVEQNRIEDNRRIDDRFEEARKEMKAEFAAVRAEMQAGFKETRERENFLLGEIIGLTKAFGAAKVWALGFYILGMGGLLYTMARGFKWL